MAGDPHWDNVALLINGTGTAASADVSQYGHTFTAYGTFPTLGSDVDALDGTSVQGVNANAYGMQTTLDQIGSLSSQVFTIEVRLNRKFDGDYFGLGYFEGFAFILRTPANLGSYEAMFYSVGGLSTIPVSTLYTSSVCAIDDYVWVALTACESGSDIIYRVFFNGILEDSATIAKTSALTIDSGTVWNIGRTDSAGFSGLRGNIDQYRLTVGVCRYSDDYTVPTEAFPTFGEVYEQPLKTWHYIPGPMPWFN